MQELFFFFFGMRCSLQDLSSPARDQTWALAVKVVSPNHWTTTEFPMQEHLNEENLKCYKDLKQSMNQWKGVYS